MHDHMINNHEARAHEQLAISDTTSKGRQFHIYHQDFGCIAGQANVSDDAQEAPPAYEERTPGVGGWRIIIVGNGYTNGPNGVKTGTNTSFTLKTLSSVFVGHNMSHCDG
uniref:Uncharacterized protein n=1 Tax=Rhizophagus irregularis (strain DAOM 181602 / DAOM 197198 / MUCL 43194) TaxID=747089 RepID=U9SWZ1_RHIID